ncbi:hypothetical protein Hanom_Chr09g00808361 [Helianthus anomalus]
MIYVADRIRRVYSRKNRAKPVGPDVVGPEHFNYIFGLWLDPLSQHNNEIVEWSGAVHNQVSRSS